MFFRRQKADFHQRQRRVLDQILLAKLGQKLIGIFPITLIFGLLEFFRNLELENWPVELRHARQLFVLFQLFGEVLKSV